MNRIFISGMGRSGTTLLDKLLANHKELAILSQPFPLLFTEIKKNYLERIGLNDMYYVLNYDFNPESYRRKDFISFLSSLKYSKKELYDLFNIMDSYSGQKTKRTHRSVFIKKLSFSNFLELYNVAISFFNVSREAKYIGSKEIMCEEYMPYLANNGFKNIILVRDPRDVLASANYPKGEKYLGNKKPTLFLLRTWKKSVEYIKSLSKNKNFHFVKYEDLVKNPYTELKKITNFLEVSNFADGYFDKGIYDQNKKLWLANSSSNNTYSFISNRSIGSYKKILSNEEIEYTEAICKKEMQFLDYNFEYDPVNNTEVIKNFRDYGVNEDKYLPANYSSTKENIEKEINRISK